MGGEADVNKDNRISKQEWTEFIGLMEKKYPDAFGQMQLVLFCGNPGTGKSTLLNSLARHRNFNSGQSHEGAGVTVQTGSARAGNVTYIDTPGLMDVDRSKTAAIEIRNALRRGNRDGRLLPSRLVFVMTTDNGRIKAQDKATMSIVLKAVPEIKSYGVIINQLHPNAKINHKEFEAKLFAGISDRAVGYVYYFPLIQAASFADNYMIDEEHIALLRKFIFDLPASKYKTVNDLYIDEMAKLQEQMDKMLHDLASSHEKMEAARMEQETLKRNHAMRSSASAKRRRNVKNGRGYPGFSGLLMDAMIASEFFAQLQV